MSTIKPREGVGERGRDRPPCSPGKKPAVPTGGSAHPASRTVTQLSVCGFKPPDLWDFSVAAHSNEYTALPGNLTFFRVSICSGPLLTSPMYSLSESDWIHALFLNWCSWRIRMLSWAQLGSVQVVMFCKGCFVGQPPARALTASLSLPTLGSEHPQRGSGWYSVDPGPVCGGHSACRAPHIRRTPRTACGK